MIVTISRQMGSFGNQVAEETARMLGYRLVWREVINEAALRAGVPEVALATIDEMGLFGLHPRSADRLAYHKAVRQVMRELAQEGNVVIVGRAGQVILQDVPEAIHVRVIAGRELRISRVCAENRVAPEQAAGMVDRSDQARGQYLKRYYQADVDDASLYDLVVNTSRVSISAAAEIVAALVAASSHSG